MTTSTRHPEQGTSPRLLVPGWGTGFKHLVALLLMVAGFCATVGVFLHSYTGQWIDETALSEVSHELIAFTDSTSEVLEAIPYVECVVAVIGLVLAVVLRRRYVPALVGVLVALAANGSAQVLKRMILDKPNLGVQEASMNSLPSGHTTFAMSVGVAFFLAAPKRWRPTIAFFTMLVSVAVGVSTVVNGWHRPADVIAAMFLVGAWAVLGLWLLRFLPAEDRDLSDTRHAGMVLLPMLTILGLFAGFSAVATYLIASTQQFVGAALLGSICLICAVGMLTTALLVFLLRRRIPPEDRCYTNVWTY